MIYDWVYGVNQLAKVAGRLPPDRVRTAEWRSHFRQSGTCSESCRLISGDGICADRRSDSACLPCGTHSCREQNKLPENCSGATSLALAVRQTGRDWDSQSMPPHAACMLAQSLYVRRGDTDLQGTAISRRCAVCCCPWPTLGPFPRLFLYIGAWHGNAGK